jgi:hypothetical protein
MKNQVTLIVSLFLFNIANCQVQDSTLIKKIPPFAFGKGQIFISPGIGFAKSATSIGAGLEYGLTNTLGISVGFSNSMFNKNSLGGYGSIKTERFTAFGLGVKLHTASNKKRKMYDFSPEITFSKLLNKPYYIDYPKVGISIAADYRVFVSKVVAFNFTVGKALNGAKKWGIGGGLTFRILN